MDLNINLNTFELDPDKSSTGQAVGRAVAVQAATLLTTIAIPTTLRFVQSKLAERKIKKMEEAAAETHETTNEE